MFTIDEINNARKLYGVKNSKLVAKRTDGSTPLPETLSKKEQAEIISMLYLHKKIQDILSSDINKNKTEEQVLQEVFQKYLPIILSGGTKEISGLKLVAGKTEDILLYDLTNTNSSTNKMANTFFIYALRQNGKKPENIQQYIQGGIANVISYDVVDIPQKTTFQQQLNPKNPIYTQPAQLLSITPEKLEHRKNILTTALKYYDMMEHDNWYAARAQNESQDMKLVASLINNSQVLQRPIPGPEFFSLLIEAQNLSLEGENDYLKEILKQPAIDKALSEFDKSGRFKLLKEEALNNRASGLVQNGKLTTHPLTPGEKTIRTANTFIHNNPGIIDTVKEKMNNESYYFSKANDSYSIGFISTVEVLAKSKGKTIQSQIDKNGNYTLNIDSSQNIEK